MKKNIAAIFAHPDDEVLGCGGTLAKYSKLGNKVHILILSQGLTSRGSKSKKELNELKNHAISSSKELGANSISFENFPDNKMDSVPLLDVIKPIEKFIKKNKIKTIFTHDLYDLNIDHSIVNRAVTIAVRPFLNDINLYTCEILSSSECNFSSENNFKPNTFVDIENTLEKKINAMNKYKTEIRNWPHPRSLKGIRYQAKMRGTQAGINLAEAFKCILKKYSGTELP